MEKIILYVDDASYAREFLANATPASARTRLPLHERQQPALRPALHCRLPPLPSIPRSPPSLLVLVQGNDAHFIFV